jgi:uncharacterized protein YndB with AHSA1/START domain
MSDDGHALRMERLVASPPEVLFALWVEPVQLVKWWAPDGCKASVEALDVRPGGGWRMTLTKPDGSRASTSGSYRVVEPPRRLSFTWAWESDNGARGHETEVTVTFDAVPGGTRLLLVQQRFESTDTCGRHTIGWSSALDRLEKTAN